MVQVIKFSTFTMKKYIVTDPCYIVHDIAYDTIGYLLDWEWAKVKTPVQLRRVGGKDRSEELQLIAVSDTPGGDGSCEHDGFSIGVDAGMLCVAYSEAGWNKESFGAKYETKEEAMRALHAILAKW